jgi:hypothetical protein
VNTYPKNEATESQSEQQQEDINTPKVLASSSLTLCIKAGLVHRHSPETIPAKQDVAINKTNKEHTQTIETVQKGAPGAPNTSEHIHKTLGQRKPKQAMTKK